MTARLSCYILFLLLLPIFGWSQVSSEIPTGTVNEDVPDIQGSAAPVKKEKKKGQFKANWNQPYPNPYRAGIYSMVIPGAGQIYNKKYWKVPIVWGGFAGLIYSLDYNKSQRDRFDEAYGASVVGLPHEFEDVLSTQALKSYRDKFNKQLQLTYVGFVALYALTALDAYVDAHLKSFDISESLSLHVRPQFQVSSANAIPAPGLAVVIPF